jgi:hypothetical protein
MIVDTVNEYSFAEAFRQVRPKNFSDEGLRALYQYLDDLSEDIGEPIELDVIALCCEYSEYKNFKELKKYYAYSHDFEDIEDLRDYTTVIEIEGSESLIIQDF